MDESKERGMNVLHGSVVMQSRNRSGGVGDEASWNGSRISVSCSEWTGNI